MTGYDGIYWDIFMVRSDRSVHHCSRHGNMLGWICHTDLYEMGLKTGITPNLQVQFASSMGNRRKHNETYGGFHKRGYAKMVGLSTKMDDLGVPLYQETSTLKMTIT